MLEDQFQRPSVLRRIRANPIGSVLEQFVDWLIARGHCSATIYQYVFAAEHFGRWVGRRGINREAVLRFRRQHLPSCRCKRPAPRKCGSTIAALNRLVEMLGSDAARPSRDSVSESLLRRYADHLTQVQGLAPVTVQYRLRYAREMLSSFRLRRLGQLRRWTVDQIRRFVASQGRHCCPASGQVLASSIRSFLRFLLLYGLIERDLCPLSPLSQTGGWHRCQTLSAVKNWRA